MTFRIFSLNCKLNTSLLMRVFLAGICFSSLEVAALTPCPSTEITSGVTVTTTCYVSSGTFTVDAGGGIIALNGFVISGNTDTLNNGGVISASNIGVFVINSGIATLNNSGTISASSYGIYLNSLASSIGTLNNTGTIGGTYGIYNRGGTIGTLNNLQGASSSALTYTGALPTNYNIIINGSSNYGQLTATHGSGSIAFNIYGNTGTTLVLGVNASVISANRYLNVLQGFSSLSGVTGTTGTYSSYRYSLVADAILADSWDLLTYLSGPSTADTQASLVNTSSALQSSITLQNTVLVNGFTYDCAVFDKNGICLSAGGRNTTVSAGSINNTSGLLIGSYRLDANNSRVGLSLDQNFSTSMPGGTIKQSNNTPMVGVFGVWQENLDTTGWQAKLSAGMGQKDTTIQRTVVGTSEPGVGSATMISQGVQAMGKYGFAVVDDVLVLPYAGLRYTRNNMGGYTEATSSSVTAPLTMNKVNTNSSAALIGVEGKYKVMPDVTVLASGGVERNMSTNYDNYIATSSTITGLTPISMNPNMVRTRPTASLGAYYDVEKNQRLGINAIYRQEIYQAVGTTTVMATYTVGL